MGVDRTAHERAVWRVVAAHAIAWRRCVGFFVGSCSQAGVGMDAQQLYNRYRELQSYVGWTDADAVRVVAIGRLVEPYLSQLADDFYDEIERHPGARRVITGGQPQIERLKGTLIRWIRDLLAGRYDAEYVMRRWRVGWRHVEIGLDQVYTNVALARLRTGLVRALQESWPGTSDVLFDTVRALDKLLDLDLAIIEDAYQAEYAMRLQRTQLALAKEQSEAAFRHLVEAAECMIVILRPDHTIVYFNPFAERLTGYSANEVQGRDYLELLLSGCDRQAVSAEFIRVIAGRPTPGFENLIRCRDGSQRSMVWNARHLVDYQGGPAILKVGQDITFLKQAQERALQAERLAAIGEVVAGLAHESRNALQRSEACLEMLALAVGDRPQALDYIHRIHKAQDHLHHLFEDVRSYAAPLSLEKRSCDVGAAWREAWAHLESARAGKQAVLREAVEGVDLYCVADSFRLEQVFRNILDNALAAGSAPVLVEVRARSLDLEGQPALFIRVGDNGPGIRLEQRPMVFKPFFTTKAKGTGLGMAIARRIIDAHGGQIALGDSDEPGAAFCITLPRGTP
jgi:PAS domain S-box-containing protein